MPRISTLRYCSVPKCHTLTTVAYCDTHRRSIQIAHLSVALLMFILGIAVGAALS